MAGTEPPLETGTVSPETERGTVGTVCQELKPEAEPSLSVKTVLNHKKKNLSRAELSEPKTGTARTVPSTNRNRTEPNRGPP